MLNKILAFGILAVVLFSCNSNQNDGQDHHDVQVAGAMKNVMWKGELGSKISLDTISGKKGLYGLGPESHLKGELLIKDGQTYVSRVTSDSTMSVQKNSELSAPFFVYAYVEEWKELELPENLRTISDLENFIDAETTTLKRPFAFKLEGKARHAVIHIQNLPEGTRVSSPEEAHQGQITYGLENEKVDIVGFFSTQHQGVFTHHDSYLHMHLINDEQNKMGHLDELEIDSMKLFLPKK